MGISHSHARERERRKLGGREQKREREMLVGEKVVSFVILPVAEEMWIIRSDAGWRSIT